MLCFMPNFKKRGGLVTVVTQDAETREVLMVAYANKEAFVLTLRTRKATYWSTSRNKLWIKGESSGNTQEIVDVLIDCDGDAVIYLVFQTGGACHTDARSCFYRSCLDARQLMDAPKAGADDQLPVFDLDQPDAPEQVVVATPQEPERISFLLPSGSLSAKMRSYLATVGYGVRERDRKGFCGSIGLIDFFERDRRTIPSLIGQSFDAGVTGKDLVCASGVTGLRVIAELPYSRASDQPTRWVLAAPGDLKQLSIVRVGCELPHLAEVLLPSVPGLPPFEVVLINGSEELAITDGLCDAVLVVTETGDSLRANGLQIVEGANNLLLSYPQILAAPHLSPAKELLLQQVASALLAAVLGGGQVLVTCDIRRSDLEALTLPAAVSPTLAPLMDPAWVAAQVCVPRASLGELLATLRTANAKAVAIQELVGYLP